MFLNYKSFIKSNIFKSFYRENSDILFLNSSFCFKNSFLSEKFFNNSNFYNIYSRFSNPSLLILEKKISFFENFKYCLVFSSGMSAIFSIFINFLFPFNYFFSTLNLFASTINFFLNFLFNFNIFVIFVNFFNLNSLYNSIFFVKLFFFETPSNPLIKLYNFNLISYISFKYNICFIVDNTFSTPILQNFFNVFIDFVIHSCTKFFDGQGRVLGGAILTNNTFLFLSLFSFLRFSGFSMTSFNSWLIFKNLDTLFIRIKNQVFNSFFFLKIFKYNLFIFKIFYSGLINYNQYKIFIFQQTFFNSLFSFVIKCLTIEMSRYNCWRFIDNFSFTINTSNLGDIFTIITNCSITTHNSMIFLTKLMLCFSESLIRISFGLEDIFDIYFISNILFNFY